MSGSATARRAVPHAQQAQALTPSCPTSAFPFPGTTFWDTSLSTPECTACATGAITVTNGNTNLTICACPPDTYGNPKPTGGCSACPSVAPPTPFDFTSYRTGFSTVDTSTTGCTCPKGSFWDSTNTCIGCATGRTTL